MSNDGDTDSQTLLHNLKRKRTRERKNATRFVTEINNFTEATTPDDREYYRDRLQDTLIKLTALDDAIHDKLSDDEYDADVDKCEEYIDLAKRAIQKASRGMEVPLASSTTDIHAAGPPSVVATTTPTPMSHSLRLPTIKLEPFSGDIETWARFWEQFESSIDRDASLSTINKHIFLRGYLEGEPKQLVEGISIMAETYEETKRILQTRYGDKNRIIQAHLDFLEDVRPVQLGTPEALNTTYIECHRRIQALRALGEDINGYGRVLAPKILRAFPDDICRRWIIHVRREKISEGDILRLMEFLGEEVDGALVTQKIRGMSFSSANIPTTATFHVNAKTGGRSRKEKNTAEPFCVFCESRGHWAQDCKKVQHVDERISKLKTANRCFLCLNRGHSAKDCSRKGRAQCIHCKGSHHKSVCTRIRSSEPSAHPTSFTTVNRIDVPSPDFTYLQTARVWVTGPTGLSKLTRCVLDGGSQSSFISESIVDELRLDVVDRRDLAIGAFERSPTAPSPRRLVKFSLKSAWTNSIVRITAFESNHVFCTQQAVPHDVRVLACARKLQLADPKCGDEELPIEVLIGGDHYWKLVKDNAPIRISSSLVLIPSIFGWVLSGNQTGITVGATTVNYIHSEQSLLPSDDAIRQFWDLETIGITPEQDRATTARDSAILEEFHASYSIEDRRRVVRFPRKTTDPAPKNFHNAERRFDALERRLERNGTLRHAYETAMLDYITKEHVELAPSHESADTFYLPHHIVRKEKRGSTKWRIVFDGSSHEANAPSLNDILEMGPNLLPEMTAVLMRFRLQPFAVITDITQAFLQLVVHPNDRDLTRFFWYQLTDNGASEPITTRERAIYRFKRLPFGLTCSPFLLSATLRELAATHQSQFPTAAPLIDKSTFMDDFVAGAEDDNSIVTLYYELTSLLKQLRFHLSKWATNSSQLIEIWRAEGREVTSNAQVLGISWNTEKDTFALDHREVTDKVKEEVATKRNLLQATASFYDPLGLVTPISIVGKILFQDTWTRGIGWDELLPHDLAIRWNTWISTLPSLSNIAVPRWVGTSKAGNLHVHVFCDASERAYGAAIYIECTIDTQTNVHLMCSKSRLAPVKKTTLPRLELLAALVGTRLLKYYCKTTNFDSRRATLWTDSTVALGWIKSDANRWKTFVCNRVTEIQASTSPSQWQHCPGEDNPADHLTRGTTPDDLAALDTWWHGPIWLSQQPFQRSNESSRPTTPAQLPEARRSNPEVLLINIPEPLIDSKRFSSYWRLLRVTARIFRLRQKLLHREHPTGEFTAEEMSAARDHWIQAVQQECFPAEVRALRENVPLPDKSKLKCFNPFWDNGFIRLGGRLQYADLPKEQRHPVILEGDHHFTRLLILETHIRLHHLGVRIVLSELRTSYWILRARRAIKKVIHRCLPCKIANNVVGQEIEAPLPADRVTSHRPFAVSGIDFAGPLYSKAAKKCYIVLFTCATTRALHLELSSDMTADRFLLALQRFIGRRGIPHTIYSDNARTFHAVNKELAELWSAVSAAKTHQYLSQQGICWKFIAPRAAWWGGWWERMVGSTKRCLRKVLGHSSMNEEELQTVLVNIEAALNSRPITQNDDEALTPAHFLVGGRLTTLPTGPEPQKTDLIKEFRRRQKAADDFWKRWSREYLMLLQSFHEARQPRGNSPKFRVGDVVLLKDDIRPRHMWKKARIEELRAGRDAVIRTVRLRIPNGNTVTRPIQLVIPLEIDQGGEDVRNRDP